MWSPHARCRVAPPGNPAQGDTHTGIADMTQAISDVQPHITPPPKYGDRQVMAKMFKVRKKYLQTDKCHRKIGDAHD